MKERRPVGETGRRQRIVAWGCPPDIVYRILDRENKGKTSKFQDSAKENGVVSSHKWWYNESDNLYRR